MRLYGLGVRTWASSPRLMGWGLLPGLITAGLFAALGLSMWWWLDDVARWAVSLVGVTGTLARVLELAFMVSAAVTVLTVMVFTFVSVTTVVGQPFFEKLAFAVDDAHGGAPAAPVWPWWRNAIRGIGEGVVLAAIQLPLVVAVSLLGVVPLVGTVASWVAGAAVGGWFLALELTSIPYERRGIVLGGRRRALGASRARTLGFGMTAFVVAILPPLAVAMMPAAIAGGTLLARVSLGEGLHPMGRGTEGA